MKTIEVQVTVKDNDRSTQQPQTSIQNAQAIFSKYISGNRKISEELIQERREEALRE
jgi:hypothetical protein